MLEIIEAKETGKNKFGQYFTPEDVAEFMVKLSSKNSNSNVLEPSCGEGVFIEKLLAKGFINIDAFEIDKSLAQMYTNVKYESFVSATIEKKYDLIIGNPPYIRWKNLEEELKAELSRSDLWNKYFNSLCDYLYIFILKSIELLEDSGELIFICPEYWMNTTHSESLRNYIVNKGHFESIFHFNETPIFENANVSIVIFKFVKSKQPKSNKIKVAKYHSRIKLNSEILNDLILEKQNDEIEFLSVSQFKTNERWLLQSDEVRSELKELEIACKSSLPVNLFENDKFIYNTIGEICDIGNGMVSGLDKAFQLNNENTLTQLEQDSLINVIKAKDLMPFKYSSITKYIYVNGSTNLTEVEFSKLYPNFYSQLIKFKDDLSKRYNYNREIKFWEWVFLRNYNLFIRNEAKIFVPCKERISNKNYFRFTYVEPGIFPTQDVTAIFKKSDTKESIEYILGYLNHPIVFDWIKCNGIVKGSIVEFSEKPIANAPFRKINWDNPIECKIHEQITKMVKNICFDNTKTKPSLKELNQLYSKLLKP